MFIKCGYCGKTYEWKKTWEKAKKEGMLGDYTATRYYCCKKCGKLAKKENAIKTLQQKYSCTSINEIPGVKEKRAKTNLERYGAENTFGSLEIQEKIKRTNNEKYGVDYPSQNKEIKDKMNTTLQKHYGVTVPAKAEEIKNKAKKIYCERYTKKGIGGSNNPNYKKAMQDKYNVDNPFQAEEVKDKSKETCKKRYGAEHYQSTDGFKNLFKDDKFIKRLTEKSYNSKKINGTFSKSKNEEKIYAMLCSKFGENNVKRQYSSTLYPFHCDFYVSNLDLYIEYQGHWTHGKEPYDENDTKHKEVVDLWKARALKKNFKNEYKKQYEKAVQIWTTSDVNKRNTAIKNNLNWLEFFTLQEFNDWCNKD